MDLAILGPIAVGKTSVGTRVARQLGLPWFDSDDQIRSEHGVTGKVIAARAGVAELHRIELAMLHEALSTAGSVVLCPAASVVDVDEGRTALAGDDVCCVLLMAEVETILQRVSADDHRRPIGSEELDRLYRRRMPIWRELASAVFTTDERDADAVAADVVALYRTRTDAARGGIASGGYDREH